MQSCKTFFVLLALTGAAFYGASAQQLIVRTPEQRPVVESAITDLSSAAGIQWQFKPAYARWQPILVPAGGWRAQGLTCDAGTYHAVIPVPESAAGKTVLLHFAAVNFGATVLAGPDEAHLQPVVKHLNGWMPFTADITAAASPGKSVVIEVEVNGRNKYKTAAGKFTVPEGASWYTGLADGILRGVTLELANPVRVDDIYVVTKRDPDTLELQATVQNDRSTAVSISLAAAVSGKESAYPDVPSATVTVPPHAHSTVTFPPVAWTPGPHSYWWPNVPYVSGYRARLHSVTVTASEDGTPLDARTQRFGFREFKVVGNHYELNGVHINLRGDNQQEANFGTDAYGIKKGFGPPGAGNGGWPYAVNNLQRLNFNVMRIHQIPATPYMLDVADEMGLMLVGESALRGSEHLEDFTAGHNTMLAYDREMVLRDRNHPAIVIWSAANEWAAPMKEAQPLIRTVDKTRPIIADGVNFDIAPDIINMEHYTGNGTGIAHGIAALPQVGGQQRTDRPYGETEAVWSADNTLQGFTWMATSVLTRRALGNADLRNYVLNNAWPNYVPGEGPKTEILERAVKNIYPTGNPADMAIPPAIADPWNNPHIQLMQQKYAPVLAADIDFENDNALSNAAGQWPVVKSQITGGGKATRTLTVFNDDLFGSALTVTWQVLGPSGLITEGKSELDIVPGERAEVPVTFNAPATPSQITIKVQVAKDGRERYSEDRMVYDIVKQAQESYRDPHE